MNLRRTMEINQYQDEASKTAVYPDIGNNIYYPAMGLCGEAGEVIEKCKKLMRGDYELSSDVKQAIALEVSDCLWYIAILSKELGYTLEQIGTMNIEKLRSRQERNKIKGSGDNR